MIVKFICLAYEHGFYQNKRSLCVYKQILKLQPGRNDVSLRLAEMYENLQLVSDALSTYEQAASAFAREGDIDRALEILTNNGVEIPIVVKHRQFTINIKYRLGEIVRYGHNEDLTKFAESRVQGIVFDLKEYLNDITNQ